MRSHAARATYQKAAGEVKQPFNREFRAASDPDVDQALVDYMMQKDAQGSDA